MIALIDLLHNSPAPYLKTTGQFIKPEIKIYIKIILFAINMRGLHVFRKDAAETSGEGIIPAHKLGIKRR
jgi:hypothetical protein